MMVRAKSIGGVRMPDRDSVAVERPVGNERRNGSRRLEGWRWCMPICGTLAWRDGFKTGPATPNGQDAYDGKLIVW